MLIDPPVDLVLLMNGVECCLYWTDEWIYNPIVVSTGFGGNIS